LAAEAPIGRFVPGAVNLFAMIFCMTGLTTLLSSWDRDRWRTILWAGGLFIASSILKFVARLWEGGAWLRYLSFLSGFEPQRLILLPPEESAPMAWQYNGTLLGLGLAGYLIAAAVFTYRDIPQAH
jgi:ABC-2 type transport system permease protein